MSLREELGAAAEPVPPFGLLLPTGWQAMEPTRESFDVLIREASQRFRAAGRPDLDAQFRTMIEGSAARFLSRDPVKMYLQRSVPEDTMLPLSMTATRVTGPDGQSLDSWVTQLVRDKAAAPFGDRSIMRWVSETTNRVQGTAVPTMSINYLTPVPDTGRRRGLLFTAVVPLGSEPRIDDELLAGLILLCDAIVSTFRWDPLP